MAEDGHFLALRLAPFVGDARKLDTYIAASQIGITLTSLILGAYGQAAISPTIAEWIMPWASGDAAWARSAASITTLVVLTTFNADGEVLRRIIRAPILPPPCRRSRVRYSRS